MANILYDHHASKDELIIKFTKYILFSRNKFKPFNSNQEYSLKFVLNARKSHLPFFSPFSLVL